MFLRSHFSRKRQRFQPGPFSGERPFAPTRELHNHLKSSSRKACPDYPAPMCASFVIPHLFRDLGFVSIQGRLHDLERQRRTGLVSVRLLLNVCRSLSPRSRTGALRDDNMGESRDDTPKRHPDNAPGQDPYSNGRRIFVD